MKYASIRNLLVSPAFWGAVVLSAIIAGAAFYNLANYPVLWWDEAIFSETAANLVQHRRYAFTVQSPDQVSDLDYRISAGPAVILPVALAYQVLGVGLVQGRLVAGLYLVSAFLALFLASRRVFGRSAAYLGVVLALTGTDVIYWGRSVLGDVPALGLFLFGLNFLIRELEEEKAGLSSFWGGLFLGLAFDAKEFYGLAFIPPMIALAHRHWRAWPRLAQRMGLYLLGLALPLGAYLALKVVILGGLWPAVWHFWEQKALLRHEFFTPLTIGRVYGESIRYLLTHPLFGAALVSAVWLWRTNTLTPARTLWLGNFLLWTVVYCTAIFWYRFALPALFLAAPLTAWLVLRIIHHLTAGVPRPKLIWVQAGLLALFFTWLAPVMGLGHMKIMLEHQEQPPIRVVEFLQRQLPTHYLIETPEYELAFLDDHHRFHLMPAFFFVESSEEGVKLLNPRRTPYDFNQTQAEVLILGCFGKSIFSQVYPPALVNRYWQKVAQIHDYDIYVRRPERLPGKKPQPGENFRSSSWPFQSLDNVQLHEPHASHRQLSD